MFVWHEIYHRMQLAFIYESVVNGVENLMVVVIVTHFVKPLIRIHKTELKVKLFC